jgi:hypothetical protein
MAKTWYSRIKSAKKRGEFTDDDVRLACDWVTCACGSLKTERLADGCPSDGPLSDLGLDFMNAVEAHAVSKASKILQKIEKRATILSTIAHYIKDAAKHGVTLQVAD